LLLTRAAKKQKTEHISPTRPRDAVEEVQLTQPEEPNAQQSREYHVYQLEIDQSEVMVRYQLF
jgi:hypothetical protein